MAQSKCPRCENTNFEMKYDSPLGATYQVSLVQCAQCGAVVGVTDRNDTAAVIDPISRKLEI